VEKWESVDDRTTQNKLRLVRVLAHPGNNKKASVEIYDDDDKMTTSIIIWNNNTIYRLSFYLPVTVRLYIYK